MPAKKQPQTKMYLDTSIKESNYLVFLNSTSINYPNHYTVIKSHEGRLLKHLSRSIGEGNWEPEYIKLENDKVESVETVLANCNRSHYVQVPIYDREARCLLRDPVIYKDTKIKPLTYELIPKQFSTNYSITQPWDGLEDVLARYTKYYQLDLDPDFQRIHVWNDAKRSAYIEHIMSGGESAKEIYFNCVGWQSNVMPGPMVLVDGKQRLEAVRRFLANELKVFKDYTYSQILGYQNITSHNFTFCVNSLSTRKEVLQWYLQINAGGVAHTKAEIEKAKELLALEMAKESA